MDVCINSPKEKLNSAIISQPATYVTNLAAVKLFRAHDGGQRIINSVDVICGLSLRKYTAQACRHLSPSWTTCKPINT